MSTITDIFTTYASEYIERYPNLPASHHKAIDAICRCRTGAYGYSLYAASVVNSITTSLMPVAIGTVHSVNIIRPRSGCTTNSVHSCPDRIS
jgi:hypothetical protein